MSVLDSTRVGPPTSQTVVRFVHAKPRDVRSLQSWKRAASNIANPSARDSAVLAKAAFTKWSQCRQEHRAASSLREAMDLIRNNPHEEVAMLVLAKSALPGAASSRRNSATSPENGSVQKKAGRSRGGHIDRKPELWLVIKMGELKTERVLTMDDPVDIETCHPIMIGSAAAFGRIEQPAARRHVERARAAKHARRARRRAARKRA